MSAGHSELVRAGERWLRKLGFGVVMTELRCYCPTEEEPDVLGLRADASVLIEAKVSRADFLRDKLKPFRVDPTLGVGDWRFYLSPPDVIRIEDLPANWGLLWAEGRQVTVLRGLPEPLWKWHEGPFQGNKAVERSFMFSCLRRVQRTKLGRELSTAPG